MYYEITVKVRRTTGKGTEKEVTERYITDCNLFSEAEAEGLHLLAEDNLEGDVIAIRRSNVREIVNGSEDEEFFFRATIADVFVDDNGKEKELKYNVLVKAGDLAEATSKANEYMRQGLQDMRLDGVVKTKILDVI